MTQHRQRIPVTMLQDALDAAHELGNRESTPDAVRAFYASRDLEPAWVNGHGLTGDAAKALAVLRSAEVHGLDPDDYNLPALATDADVLRDGGPKGLPDDERQNAAVQFELRLTAALMDLGHDVAVGRIAPSSVDRHWESQRTSPDVAATLVTAVDESELPEWLGEVQPPHAQYAALRRVLEQNADHLDAAKRGAIAANLERWRWMPDTLGDRHVFVNIPSYTLTAVGGPAGTLTMRVVVGKARTNETPVLSSEMRQVVFSPYWNIPESIVESETLPAVSKDPDYLSKHNIEVVQTANGGRTLYRQRPGPQNALGLVKFLFENDFDVYLHDTPTESAFAQNNRALSHGCVRLEHPEALAAWVLAGEDGDWDRPRIERAMHSRDEKWVRLGHEIPVHIAYFTVVVDEDGTPRFLADIYGHDKAQQTRLLAAK